MIWTVCWVYGCCCVVQSLHQLDLKPLLFPVSELKHHVEHGSESFIFDPSVDLQLFLKLYRSSLLFLSARVGIFFLASLMNNLWGYASWRCINSTIVLIKCSQVRSLCAVGPG